MKIRNCSALKRSAKKNKSILVPFTLLFVGLIWGRACVDVMVGKVRS